MKNDIARRRGLVVRIVAAAVFVVHAGGCQGMREMVAIPFDMAAHVAVETARMPYDAAKIGVQGMVDVVAAAMK